MGRCTPCLQASSPACAMTAPGPHAFAAVTWLGTACRPHAARSAERSADGSARAGRAGPQLPGVRGLVGDHGHDGRLPGGPRLWRHRVHALPPRHRLLPRPADGAPRLGSAPVWLRPHSLCRAHGIEPVGDSKERTHSCALVLCGHRARRRHSRCMHGSRSESELVFFFFFFFFGVGVAGPNEGFLHNVARL